jgi:hypothetical protein
MSQAAIEIRLKIDDVVDTYYVVLPIHEYRASGPVFSVPDDTSNGTHLLSADDVRGSWNGWVRDLVRDDQILTQAELDQEYPEIEGY